MKGANGKRRGRELAAIPPSTSSLVVSPVTSSESEQAAASVFKVEVEEEHKVKGGKKRKLDSKATGQGANSSNLELESATPVRLTASDEESPEKVRDKIELLVASSQIKFVRLGWKSIRFGSYKVVNSSGPDLHVTITELGITVTLPTSHSRYAITNMVKVCVPMDEILQFQVCFNKRLPVIFVKTTVKYARWARAVLGMDEDGGDGLYFCPESECESQKSIVMILNHFMDLDVGVMKKIMFGNKSKLKGVDYAEANSYLLKVVPPSSNINQLYCKNYM